MTVRIAFSEVLNKKNEGSGMLFMKSLFSCAGTGKSSWNSGCLKELIL